MAKTYKGQSQIDRARKLLTDLEFELMPDQNESDWKANASVINDKAMAVQSIMRDIIIMVKV